MENKNKVLVHVHGDPTVGIPSQDVWVEMPMLWEGDTEYNEFIRETLHDAFSQIYDSGCDVYLNEKEIYPL